MPYRQILNDRCLIFLIDEIKEFLYEDKTFNSTITAEHIDDKTLAQTFIFLYLCKQKGIDIGQNRLFQKLRNNGYLIQKKRSKLEYANTKEHGNGIV